MISGASQSNPYMTRSVATPASNPLGVEWVGGASTSTPAAPAQQAASQPVAQNQVQPMAQVLSQIFTGLMNAVKSLVSWIAGLFNQQPAQQQPAQTPVTQQPTQPPVTQPTQPSTGVDYATIAQQYNLYPSAENVQAFLNEVKTY